MSLIVPYEVDGSGSSADYEVLDISSYIGSGSNLKSTVKSATMYRYGRITQLYIALNASSDYTISESDFHGYSPYISMATLSSWLDGKLKPVFQGGNAICGEWNSQWSNFRADMQIYGSGTTGNFVLFNPSTSITISSSKDDAIDLKAMFINSYTV